MTPTELSPKISVSLNERAMSAILEQPKVNLHAAVASALSFLKEAFTAATEPRNLQLEEIEMSDDGRRWLVTLGYDDPAAAQLPTVDQLMRPRPLRKYKVVHVDAESGKATAIKNR